ncbi:MAG: zinc ribbon domain-containing protein [Thermodesulfobacteriota bacterium]|nr:zinc ribbon domain-containing protein [Thermodesulfobacteriota bacterium]
MPIYEYHCAKCNNEFELMRPVKEIDEPALCPHCGSEGEKIISGFASKTGFYIKAAKKPYRESQKEK